MLEHLISIQMPLAVPRVICILLKVRMILTIHHVKAPADAPDLLVEQYLKTRQTFVMVHKSGFLQEI